MAGTTPKRGLPYPGNADVPDIAGDIQDLATAVDTKLGSAGKCIIATEEARTNTAYGLLTTHDEVTGIVLPTDGLIIVAYQAMWKESVASAARAAIFLGAAQLKAADQTNTAPVTTTAETLHGGTGGNLYKPLSTNVSGLFGESSGVAAYGGDVTTGQVVAALSETTTKGGICHIFAAAGTYTVSVQFKASSGSVTAKVRKLWVWTQPF